MRLALVVLALSLLLIPMTAAIPATADRHAAFVQLVETDPERDELLGGPIYIGRPGRRVVPDDRALLNGVSPEGARYMSATYLRETGQYAYEPRTIEEVCRLLQIGAAIMFVGSLMLLLISRGILERGRYTTPILSDPRFRRPERVNRSASPTDPRPSSSSRPTS